MCWWRYKTGNEAPGNFGGFHKAVIDTEQPGTRWTLSAKMVVHHVMGQRLTGPHFAALTRENYACFVSDKSAIKDQCRGHLKIKMFGPLKTGKFVFRDVLDDPHGEMDSISMDDPRKTADGMIELPMDGYYPITIHHDIDGKIAMIFIAFGPAVKPSNGKYSK